MDVQEDVPVAVAVINLQQRRVLRPLRAVVDVLDLLPRQLRQLKLAERPAAVEPREVAVARRFKNHNQAVRRVVGVFNLQDWLGDGRLDAAAPHEQRSQSHDPRRLRIIEMKI